MEQADQAYDELLGAFEIDGKQSDSYSAVKARQLEFRRKGGALAAKALAGQQFMEAAAGPVKDSKSNDQDAGGKALEKIQKTQFWPDWMLHQAGKETHMEQARKQLEDDMSANETTRVNALNGKYKEPAGGDYGFDGRPTSWNSGGVKSETGRTDAGSDTAVGPVESETGQTSFGRDAPAHPVKSETGQASFGSDAPARPVVSETGRTDTQQGASRTDESGQQSAVPGAGGQGAGGASASQGAGGSGSGGAGAPTGSGSAATGLQSGAAVAGKPQAAPPPSISGGGAGGGGGAGALPSIGGLAGGPGAGAGLAPRIGGLGGGSEAPRTGVQGAGVAEKPAAQSSSSGSGPQQGSGLSRGGGGVGAGGATHAQSAQQAALRDALRGDTAGGASGTGRRLDHQNQALGTVRAAQLSPTALQSAHAQSAQLLSSFGGLAGSLASAHPASGAGELAHWIVNGGTIVGAGRAGFLADGVTWGRVEQPPFEHVGVTGLVLLFEDSRVEPNRDAGVFRPVAARVTTTGWMGEADPEMRLPEGTRILDRSQAPAATDHITDAGLLARGLGRWLLDSGLDGDRSWRLVAVCFLEEPDTESVDGLLRLQHQVESYWPGRPGYEADVPQTAVADARSLGGEELRVKQNDPLRHAQDLARLDPDGLYDPTGLPAKEAAWYREAAERAQRPQLTNARWKQELDQYRREERGGGPNW
ncbi:MAG: hypothetical protein ACRC20_07630 [Segniliparus sp.]|uniref:hypothetical protein n=1 Tax=Segniliparus sp. TaxID=2804064 RepID=UPI003F415B4F